MSVLVYGTTGQMYAAFGVASVGAAVLPSRFLGQLDPLALPSLPSVGYGQFAGEELCGEWPLKKKSEQHYEATRHQFAYTNDEGHLCRLDLQYRKDDPGKWIFSLLVGMELEQSEQMVYVLSSKKLALQADHACQKRKNEPIEHFIANLKSPFARSFFNAALQPGYILHIDPRCSVFDHISQPITSGELQDSRPLLALLLPATALQQLLPQHELLAQLSSWGATPAQMARVLQKQGALYQWMNDNLNIPENIISWAILLDKQNAWPAFEQLFSSRLFMEVIADDPRLGRCLARLLDEGRSIADLIAIAQNPGYQNAVEMLTQVGLYTFQLDDLTPKTLAALARLQEYLNNQAQSSTPHPQLALIIRNFIACLRYGTEVSSLMSQLLQPQIITDPSGMFAPLFGELCNIVLDAPLGEPDIMCRVITQLNRVLPLQADAKVAEYYREALVWAYHFKNLSHLDQQQLDDILSAFVACREADFDSFTWPLWVLNANSPLRNAVLKLAGTDNLEQFLKLAEPLRSQTAIALQQVNRDCINPLDRKKYTQLILDSTTASQNFICVLTHSNSEIGNLLLESVYAYCTNVPDPYSEHDSSAEKRSILAVCTNLNKLTLLNFDADVRRLFVENTPNGQRFRDAMNTVEAGCERIRTHLHETANNSAKNQQFSQLVTAYRLAMYQAVYTELTRKDEPSTLVADIQSAEAPLKNELSVDRQYGLRICMKILANIAAGLFGLFSCFQLNYRHQQKTGHFLFFSEPTSAGILNETDREVDRIMTAPMA